MAGFVVLCIDKGRKVLKICCYTVVSGSLKDKRHLFNGFFPCIGRYDELGKHRIIEWRNTYAVADPCLYSNSIRHNDFIYFS